MIGLHRLQHVVRLRAAALADDDAIGTTTQRQRHQLAHAHRSLALRVRLARLHPLHMRRLQAQLGRVLDGDHPLVGRDEPRESAQEGGLDRKSTRLNSSHSGKSGWQWEAVMRSEIK